MKEETSAYAHTPLNRAAGSAIRTARQHRKLTQAAMAEHLADALGDKVTEGQVGHYERATRTVPAPVLLGAALVAELPVWALLEELEDQARYNAWLAAVSEVEGLREELVVVKAQVVHLYSRFGIPLENHSLTPPGDSGSRPVSAGMP